MGREALNMMLHILLRQFDPQLTLAGIGDVEISGVREDSRLVERGDLFIARGGTKTSGVEFVADATARGAVAIVTETKIPSCAAPQVRVEDAARAAAVFANL